MLDEHMEDMVRLFKEEGIPVDPDAIARLSLLRHTLEQLNEVSEPPLLRATEASLGRGPARRPRLG